MIEATDVTLTKIEKNRILKLILEYGPPADEFQWSEKQREEYSYMAYRPYRVSVLTHHPTGYYCIFGGHNVMTSPGLNKKVEEFDHEDRWEKKENACGRWLVDVKLEVEAPDLWASIGQEKALSTAAASRDIDNRPFTDAEQRLIAARLDEIKGYILDGQQLTADQGETVDRELAYLRESSERLGRKDWLNNLLGGLVGLAIGLALDPEKARGLLGLAGAVFQSLWGTAQGYLP
jgi:hypothetical protein